MEQEYPSEKTLEVMIEHTEDTEGLLLYDESGNPRKLPVPSDDPNDPLNFGPWRQRLILAAICAYGVTGFGVIQSTPLFFGEIIPEYMKETRGTFNPALIDQLASYPSLCMGLGNFFFVPLSMALGRRFTLLLTNTIMLVAIIWAAKSTSFTSHLGARCLQGLSAGLSDCLLPIVVLDTSFLYQRSERLVVYWAVTAIASSLLLIPIPVIVEHAGGNWRINYWYWAGFAALSLVMVATCLPETLFQRQAVWVGGQIHASDAYGTLRTFSTVEEANAAGFEVEESSNNSARKEFSHARQLSPLHVQKAPVKKFASAYVHIVKGLLVPGTVWALAVNSLVFGGLVILSLTYAQLLESPPWNFAPSAIGTVQAGAVIGAFFGLGIGKMAEPISGFFTRRNRGLRQPEHILPNFVFPTTMCFLGLLVYGIVGSDPATHHWIGIYAAFALFYFGFCAVSALTGAWLGELLPHMSGPAIVLVCGGRNAISFAFTNAFSAWEASGGFLVPHATYASILLGLGLMSIPLFFVNPFFREMTRNLVH